MKILCKSQRNELAYAIIIAIIAIATIEIIPNPFDSFIAM
jgi:hypothetical protein